MRLENKTPESVSLSGVLALYRLLRRFLVGFVVGRLNLECSQQDRTDEREDGGDSEHIQFQGKVHAAPPLLMWPKASTRGRGAEARCRPRNRKI
jgi:hypothetical protein